MPRAAYNHMQRTTQHAMERAALCDKPSIGITLAWPVTALRATLQFVACHIRLVESEWFSEWHCISHRWTIYAMYLSPSARHPNSMHGACRGYCRRRSHFGAAASRRWGSVIRTGALPVLRPDAVVVSMDVTGPWAVMRSEHAQPPMNGLGCSVGAAVGS